MAATAVGAQLTELQRAAQLRLAAQVVAQMRATWGLLDLDELDATFERWLRIAVPVVQTNRAMSARLAAAYLAAFRKAELGTLDGLPAVMAAPVDVKAVTRSLLFTGPWSVKHAMTKGVDLARAVDVAEARSSAAAMRHVLDGGRGTILSTVAADENALGWARVASANSCAWCAMVASRGPEYGSEASASFEPHDGCQCGAEPVYQPDAAWPPNSERYRELWDEHTAGAGTGRGDALNAFRRALARG
jgi:hypothetical protein